MRGELEYQSTTFGECPSDYDFKCIHNLAELKFLKWTDILQGTITRLKYNIEMYEYFLNLYLLNNIIKHEFVGFFSILLSDLTMLIAIDFSSILKNSELKIREYKSFCDENPELFKAAKIETASQLFDDDFDKIVQQYNNFFDTPRNKLFAHMDKTLLNQEAVNHMMDRVGTAKMKSLLQSLMRVLSSFWFAYNGKKLCFELKQGDDYKKLAFTECNAYGDTKFI